MDVLETRFEIKISSGLMAGLKWSPLANDDAEVALIFLHANGFCASTYRALLSDLARSTGKSVIGLDLRGHGRSQLPANPDLQDSWDRHARDIGEAVHLLAPGGCVLAGHSMGGTSALLASARAPSLVKGLCLFDPVLGPASFYLYARLPWVFDNWRKNFPMARAAGKRRAEFPSRAAAVAAYEGRGAFKTWPRCTIADYCDDGFTDTGDGQVRLSCAPAFEAACFAGQRHNPLSALRTVRSPAKLLRGAKRSTTPALLIPKLKRSGFVVETIEDTSHFLPMERSDICLAALVDTMSQAKVKAAQAA